MRIGNQLRSFWMQRVTIENLRDGRVELVAQGEPDEVEAFLDEILESSLKSHIQRHIDREIAVEPSLKGFRIVR